MPKMYIRKDQRGATRATFGDVAPSKFHLRAAVGSLSIKFMLSGVICRKIQDMYPDLNINQAVKQFVVACVPKGEL